MPRLRLARYSRWPLVVPPMSTLSHFCSISVARTKSKLTSNTWWCFQASGMIDQPTTRLPDWSTDWLADWLTDWLAGLLTDWLTEWLTHLLIDWPIGWMTDPLTSRLTDLKRGKAADWFSCITDPTPRAFLVFLWRSYLWPTQFRVQHFPGRSYLWPTQFQVQHFPGCVIGDFLLAPACPILYGRAFLIQHWDLELTRVLWKRKLAELGIEL